MVEFLVTRANKGEYNFGFNIQRKIDIVEQYPWGKNCKICKFVDWYILINLFIFEFSWLYSKKIS